MITLMLEMTAYYVDFDNNKINNNINLLFSHYIILLFRYKCFY